MGKLTKRTSSSSDIVKRSPTENNNDPQDHSRVSNGSNKKHSHKTSHHSILPDSILDEVSNKILEHVKQLGLFDEMRMKLLETIETSKEFLEIKSEFMREIDAFCTEVDLTLPRSRLRERLKSHTRSKAANRLNNHVQDVSRAHKHELKMLYNEKADKFIRSTISNHQDDSTKTSIKLEEQSRIHGKAKLHNEHHKGVNNNNKNNSGSNHLSSKPFNGKSVSLQRETNCDHLRKKSKKTLVV